MQDDDLRNQLVGLFSDVEIPKPQPELTAEGARSQAFREVPTAVKSVGVAAPAREALPRVEPSLVAEVQTVRTRERTPPTKDLRAKRQQFALGALRAIVIVGFLAIAAATCLALSPQYNSKLSGATGLDLSSPASSAIEFREAWLGFTCRRKAFSEDSAWNYVTWETCQAATNCKPKTQRGRSGFASR